MKPALCVKSGIDDSLTHQAALTGWTAAVSGLRVIKQATEAIT